MRHKNHVSLIGTVGKDSEVRTTQGGVQYARFSLATSSGGYQKQDGTQVPEKTEWHNIVAWRNLADFCGKYVKKGMKIDVEGMLTYTQYKDQQGIDRMGVEIVASDIVLMSQPQQGAQQGAPQVNGGYGQQIPPQQGYVVQQQQFPPQVNPNGQPIAQNYGNGYQQQPAMGPSSDDLPF